MKGFLRSVALVPLLFAIVTEPRAVFERQATPMASPMFPSTPSPEECLIAPRTWAELEGLIGVATPSAATDSLPLPTALPSGPPADAETVSAIAATVRELGACANAGDPRRLFALYTDGYLGQIGPYDAKVFVGMPATPELEEDRLSIDAVVDVQRLEDGRVAAVVVIGNRVDSDPLPGRTALYIFAGSAEGWLVDGVIEEVLTPDGVRSVASVVGTPTS